MNWGKVFSWLGHVVGMVAVAIVSGKLEIPGVPAWVPVLGTVVLAGSSDVAWKVRQANGQTPE